MTFVAITVDLGWPWWASTTIAAAVAVGAGVGFYVIRNPAARGVLATLALLGVVFAAIAPAVMDTSGMQLTRAEYASQADANCTRVGNYWASLGNPKTLPGTVKMLDLVMPVFLNGLVKQGMLVPPTAERAVAARWMDAMVSHLASLESVRAAASLGDQNGVDAANARGDRYVQESAKLSSQLGMKVCYQ